MRLEAEIAQMVNRLVAVSEHPDQPYRVTILNSPAVNAFALPGGQLYITRGLIALAMPLRSVVPRPGARKSVIFPTPGTGRACPD